MNIDMPEDTILNRERIGAQLKYIREKRGYSQRELAELVDVNFTNISKIENGRYNVSIDLLYRICKALDADINLISK